MGKHTNCKNDTAFHECDGILRHHKEKRDQTNGYTFAFCLVAVFIQNTKQ